MSGLLIVANRLQNNAPLTAVVPVPSIFLNKINQATPPPIILLRRVGGADGLHLNGQNGYPVHRIRVECNASDAVESERIGDLVDAALRNTIKATIDTYTDVDILFANVDLSEYGDEQTLDRRILEYSVRFRST